MPRYDVEVVIYLRGPGGNVHAVAMQVEEAIESAIGKDAAVEFRASYVMFIGQSDTTYEDALTFCEQWADVKYVTQ